MQPGTTVEHVEHFYQQGEFWISTILAVAGLAFSFLSFIEAKRAKKAALAAGKTVKTQTIVIELSEISQKLDNVDDSLDYGYARELLNDASRRLHRQLASIRKDADVSAVVDELFTLLDAAKEGLSAVRPSVGVATTSLLANAVFYAMDGHFSAVNSKLAELTGLLEKRTIDPH